jgi:hypothetical protein
MISLTRADGAPVVSFGSGVPFSNSQPQINSGTVTSTGLFGGGLTATGKSANTPGTITPTSASSTTKMGFTNLAAGRKAPHVGPMEAKTSMSLPTSSGAKPTADWGVEPAAGQMVPDKPASRNDAFGGGASSGRPGGDVPGGMPDTETGAL